LVVRPQIDAAIAARREPDIAAHPTRHAITRRAAVLGLRARSTSGAAARDRIVANADSAASVFALPTGRRSCGAGSVSAGTSEIGAAAVSAFPGSTARCAESSAASGECARCCSNGSTTAAGPTPPCASPWTVEVAAAADASTPRCLGVSRAPCVVSRAAQKLLVRRCDQRARGDAQQNGKLAVTKTSLSSNALSSDDLHAARTVHSRAP
jgi:hypothetical protein